MTPSPRLSFTKAAQASKSVGSDPSVPAMFRRNYAGNAPPPPPPTKTKRQSLERKRLAYERVEHERLEKERLAKMGQYLLHTHVKLR